MCALGSAADESHSGNGIKQQVPKNAALTIPNQKRSKQFSIAGCGRTWAISNEDVRWKMFLSCSHQPRVFPASCRVFFEPRSTVPAMPCAFPSASLRSMLKPNCTASSPSNGSTNWSRNTVGTGRLWAEVLVNLRSTTMRPPIPYFVLSRLSIAIANGGTPPDRPAPRPPALQLWTLGGKMRAFFFRGLSSDRVLALDPERPDREQQPT